MRFLGAGGLRWQARRWCSTAALVAVRGAQALWASNPALVCESNKNKEAGKYAFCLQKAEAKFATNGDGTARTVARQKCLDKFTAKWPTIEAKAAGSCPSTGDQDEVRSGADTYTGNLATLLAGGTLSDCA